MWLYSDDWNLMCFASAGAEWRVIQGAPGAALCLRPDVERRSRAGTG